MKELEVTESDESEEEKKKKKSTNDTISTEELANAMASEEETSDNLSEMKDSLNTETSAGEPGVNVEDLSSTSVGSDKNDSEAVTQSDDVTTDSEGSLVEQQLYTLSSEDLNEL